MQIPLIWLYTAGGFVGGALVTLVVTYLLLRREREAFEEREEKTVTRFLERIETLEASLSSIREEASMLDEELRGKSVENAALKERLAHFTKVETAMERMATRLETERERTLSLEKEVKRLETQLEAERKQAEKSLEELRNARETMREEFKFLASRIMEENSRRFGDVSKERVAEVLEPLRLQVGEFRERIERVHTEETRELATLLNEIRTLKELNRKIGEDAVNLTRALRGEHKRQGIWGEMVLERVLEASGLRKGEEYERETTLTDGENRKFRPDVVVHLPEGRDIVIDAKTSLVAYERYVNEEDEEKKKLYARHHLDAVRNHMERLSEKRYATLEGIETLDFVFMFMPIEGALMLALQTDPTLYDEAFSRHIVLVSPTTLLVALRAVENTWKHERQNRNAQEIARRAGALYDKFVAFAEDLEKIGRQIETVQRSYEKSWKKLTEGRHNLVRQVEVLRELGARTNRPMPGKLAEAAKDGISGEKKRPSKRNDT
ncbi:DNA recombination protein RmuC [Hydrogenimonas sp.]